MQVHFKYPRKVLGKLYQKGMHVLPDEASEDWFFKGLVAAKDVEIHLVAPVPEVKQMEVPLKMAVQPKKKSKAQPQKAD